MTEQNSTKEFKNPYEALPPEAFWRSAVSEVSPLAPRSLYKKKWSISIDDKVATGGSCFAQHIGKQLKQRGFQVVDMEPAPPELPPSSHMMFGFSMYSSRYGNIYTVRQLLQLAQEVFEQRDPGEIAWEKDGRFYDALRPSVEPNGLGSAAEVKAHRKYHLQQVRKMFLEMDVFVFTLGLTETWINKHNRTIYPVAPGIIAGVFNPYDFEFVNLSYNEIINDFNAFKKIIQNNRYNDTSVKFLLTVSPVPLTATASGAHVLVASTHSKSILRAVASEIARLQDDVDYFPSYEIVSSPWSRGVFYESNLRTVSKQGVGVVMDVFFQEHGTSTSQADNTVGAISLPENDSQLEYDAHCDEELLDAFGRN